MKELGSWIAESGSAVRRRVRLLMLLDAADYAVISPVSTSRLHALVFLADVLSPVYGFSGLAKRIMKRRVGPYFPDIQWEVDRLVGQGLIDVSGLKKVVEGQRVFLDASFTLNRGRTSPILQQLDEEFLSLRDFFRELAGALATVPEADLDSATQADVTWESGHQGTVIDYGEWRAQNYSRISADRIGELAKEMWGEATNELSSGAKVNLYVQYLKRAANV